MIAPPVYKIPPKPATGDYGYKRGWKLVGCSREELIERCASTDLIAVTRVWTPETLGLVRPESVDFLRPALHQYKVTRNRELGCAYIGLVLLGSFNLLMSIFINSRERIRNYLFWLALFVIILFNIHREKRRLQKSESEKSPEDHT